MIFGQNMYSINFDIRKSEKARQIERSSSNYKWVHYFIRPISFISFIAIPWSVWPAAWCTPSHFPVTVYRDHSLQAVTM